MTTLIWHLLSESKQTRQKKIKQGQVIINRSVVVVLQLSGHTRTSEIIAAQVSHVNLGQSTVELINARLE